ncbi:NAD(P)/FAD-dependent oxidoreductase [Labrenzia sp. PHM005]|uniref:NAD(P)/FAD-dependent oxidoreductase n=1 Tax=Labrenzia sp. PHM005 TaxID=2590016 RepID=UPI00113FD24B|nr:NAD(P)/FAD-dependent oxidoreductase [Labrenzia sp. PHM005]QDG76673.1 NAD(P)/FAD-dependent oxidoreductase [Labrenzia sp. PHM005]
MHDIETLVIGAGVVGLACARSLALAGREVMVLEQHDLIGSETSARNSEVIHAGIYYPTGSLKAQLCVEGKKKLYAFCKENGVGHKQTGKLIVACTADQAEKLEAIRQKAAENGVTDLIRLSAEEASDLEPELACHGALSSPSTGIVDSHGLMLALQGELETNGGQVVLNTKVTKLEALPSGGYKVSVADGDDGYAMTCRELIISAGHGAPGLAAQLPHTQAPRAYIAKGTYFRINGKSPFSTLIYPVPTTNSGLLGVHVTLDLMGRVKFGPDMQWVENFDYDVDPNRADNFYEAIRQYWPALADGALEPDYCGLRPKIHAPSDPAPDFRIDGPKDHGLNGLVALYGIESPGLTSSLAIGDYVTQQLTME